MMTRTSLSNSFISSILTFTSFLLYRECFNAIIWVAASLASETNIGLDIHLSQTKHTVGSPACISVKSLECASFMRVGIRPSTFALFLIPDKLPELGVLALGRCLVTHSNFIHLRATINEQVVFKVTDTMEVDNEIVDHGDETTSWSWVAWSLARHSISLTFEMLAGVSHHQIPAMLSFYQNLNATVENTNYFSAGLTSQPWLHYDWSSSFTRWANITPVSEVSPTCLIIRWFPRPPENKNTATSVAWRCHRITLTQLSESVFSCYSRRTYENTFNLAAWHHLEAIKFDSYVVRRTLVSLFAPDRQQRDLWTLSIRLMSAF